VAPLLLIKGRAYRLNPVDIATLGVQRLGEYVSSFADDDEARRRIQDALDFILKPIELAIRLIRRRTVSVAEPASAMTVVD
jgi:hypothetical protein